MTIPINNSIYLRSVYGGLIRQTDTTETINGFTHGYITVPKWNNNISLDEFEALVESKWITGDLINHVPQHNGSGGGVLWNPRYHYIISENLLNIVEFMEL